MQIDAMSLTRYVVIDVETTGLHPTSDRIVELAIVDITKFCTGGIPAATRNLRARSYLCNPEIPIPPEATRIHGITDTDVSGKQSFRHMSVEIHDRLKNTVLIGHNIRFDIAFLRAEFSRVGLKFNPTTFCTLEESRALIPDLESYTLESLKRHLGISAGRAHRAAHDAKSAALVYFHLRSMRSSGYQADSPSSTANESIPPTPSKAPLASGHKSKAVSAPSRLQEAPRRLASKAFKKGVSALKKQLKSLGG